MNPLEQIIRSHASARPTHENPAWLNTHADLSYALELIDTLRNALRSARKALDQAAPCLIVEQVNNALDACSSAMYVPLPGATPGRVSAKLREIAGDLADIAVSPPEELDSKMLAITASRLLAAAWDVELGETIRGEYVSREGATTVCRGCDLKAEQLASIERLLGIEPGSTDKTICGEIGRANRAYLKLESQLGNAQRQILNLRNAPYGPGKVLIDRAALWRLQEAADELQRLKRDSLSDDQNSGRTVP